MMETGGSWKKYMRIKGRKDGVDVFSFADPKNRVDIASSFSVFSFCILPALQSSIGEGT
jgi:hypothetical protein